MKKFLLSLVALSFGITLSLADSLILKGSDTLGAKLVPQLSEEFKAQHPGTSFDIAAEGSTTGIAAIIDGTAQIGMASRPAKPAEISAAEAKGVKLQSTTVPYARPTFYYTNGEPSGLAKEFVNFTIGAAGQKIVEQVGFVPIK